MKIVRTSAAVLLVLAFMVGQPLCCATIGKGCSRWFRLSRRSPTFSTANIARQGHVLCGWKEWVEQARRRSHARCDGMAGNVGAEKDSACKYPILFVQAGGGETNVALLQTPDRRPGWAYDFVNRGLHHLHDGPSGARAARLMCRARRRRLASAALWPIDGGGLSRARVRLQLAAEHWPQGYQAYAVAGRRTEQRKKWATRFLTILPRPIRRVPRARTWNGFPPDDIVALVDLIHELSDPAAPLRRVTPPAGLPRMPGQNLSRASSQRSRSRRRSRMRREAQQSPGACGSH